MNLSILYRGPLASCNYGCHYCPFSKVQHPDSQLHADAQALERFVQWVSENHRHRLAILFAPWGEGLIHGHYQQAITRLSHCANIRRVAIQTNLSCDLGWLAEVNKNSTALWCSFHPGQVSQGEFIQQCRTLRSYGIHHSVGMVGMENLIDQIESMRRELPSETYLWVNAYKHGHDYYTRQDLQRISKVDPLFHFSHTFHKSEGRACHTGEKVFCVDGDGTMRRCFVSNGTIGNIYHQQWERSLIPRPCTKPVCSCHIGYVHMPELKLNELFGEGILERIPCAPIHVSANG